MTLIVLLVIALVAFPGFFRAATAEAAEEKARDGSVEKNQAYPGLVTVAAPAEVLAPQGIPYFIGISGKTAGAQGLSMSLVVVPPGGSARPHIHRGYETAIYVLQGQVKTLYGEGLQESVVNQAGDFLFIPPGIPHQPRNLSDTEPAVAIVARNDPGEQEDVEPYDIGDA